MSKKVLILGGIAIFLLGYYLSAKISKTVVGQYLSPMA